MKHEVKVVRLGKIEKHANADTLGVTEIEGYTVVVRLAEWQEGDLGVYIEPDYVVPAVPWSAFLGEDERQRRIRVKRLRGVWSQGLLLSLSAVSLDGASEGDDVMETLGIYRYEPPEDGQQGSQRQRNPGETPHPSLAGLQKYDLESWQKHKHLLAPDEPIIVTEKIHGENARYAWRDGRMWVGSRNRWVPPDEGGGHWQTLADEPWIVDWCKANEDAVLFGESYGNVNGMRYGIEPGHRGFVAFDIWRNGRFVDASTLEFAGISSLPPALFDGLAADFSAELAEGKSVLAKWKGADHVREGVVIKPKTERWDPRIGRVALKCVGNGYFDRGL